MIGYAANRLVCGTYEAETDSSKWCYRIKKISVVIHPARVVLLGDRASEDGELVFNQSPALAFRHDKAELRQMPTKLTVSPIPSGRKANMYYFDHHVAGNTFWDLKKIKMPPEGKDWGAGAWFEGFVVSGFKGSPKP